MPRNYLFAGLIHLALPNATIIHAVRDPIDTCVSCFSHACSPGAADSTPTTWSELGRYYQALSKH